MAFEEGGLMRPDRAFAVIFQVGEPGCGLDQRRTGAVACPGQGNAVVRFDKSDALHVLTPPAGHLSHVFFVARTQTGTSARYRALSVVGMLTVIENRVTDQGSRRRKDKKMFQRTNKIRQRRTPQSETRRTLEADPRQASGRARDTARINTSRIWL